MTAAVLFDIDGTLIDTNYLHVHAWWESFEAAGHRVAAYDIHRSLGLPADDLVEALLGHVDEKVVDGHADRWAQLRPRCRPFHRAAELLTACAEAGLRVAWVTSGSEEDVEGFHAALDHEGTSWREAVHEVVSSADIERGKPHPDALGAALEALGCDADQAVFVGDTTYDARAAVAAGVRSVAVLCGGIGETELRAAGAGEVVGNPAELLEDLARYLGL